MEEKKRDYPSTKSFSKDDVPATKDSDIDAFGLEPASQPRIDIEDENKVALAETKPLESDKTEIAPQEDHIKTFLFKETDLGDTDREDGPSALQRILKTSSYVLKNAQQWSKKPKSRRILYIATAVFLGLLVFYLMEGETYFRREPINPNTAINSEESFQKLRRSERKRVILFQIDQIQKLISKRDLKKADEKMRKLTILAAKNEDFIAYEKLYQRQRELILIEEQKKQQEAQEREEKRDRWLSEGTSHIEGKKYDLAKKAYSKVLELFPDNIEAQEQMQTIELLEEQEERKAFAKKKRYAMLDKIYREGVQKYESGQFGLAKNLFRKVREERKHPKYKSSVSYLNKIANLTDKKLDAKIKKARELAQSINTLPKGYQELKKISSQFPLRSDAKTYLAEAKEKMYKKARQLYADGLAQEQLAGDLPAALDLYKEVLKYAPESSDEYHIKAKSKIEALQL